MHYDFLDGDNGTQSIQSKDLSNALLSTLTTQELLQHVDLSELPEATPTSLYDNILIETPEGQHKKAMAWKFAYDSVIDGSEAHKSKWRGLNLGTFITDEQYASIADGSFKGLFLGDYWRINDIVWRIVDINYWFNSGNTHVCRQHHLVIMPDLRLYDAIMNDTATSSGGYVGSKMFSSGLIEASNIINSAFGSDHILRYDDMLTNSVTDGVANESLWTYITLSVPTIPMVFGSWIWESAKNNIQPSRYGVSNRMLAGLLANPWLVNNNRWGYWLRDPSGSNAFFTVDATGSLGSEKSNVVIGVRPVFGIVG